MQFNTKSKVFDEANRFVRDLLVHPPQCYRVEPVYADTDQRYRYARRFSLRLLDCQESILEDEPIEFHTGDQYLVLDLNSQGAIAQQAFYQKLSNFGVKVNFIEPDSMGKLYSTRS
jgi:hypothetical protein